MASGQTRRTDNVHIVFGSLHRHFCRRLKKGSDIDIVIIMQDHLPEELKSQIESEMTALKSY